jgi:hypothetical protein
LCIIFVLGQPRRLSPFIAEFSILFAVQGALRASPEADPPQNMHRTIIFNGVWVSTVAASIYFLRGKQVRRELDEEMNKEQVTMSMNLVGPSLVEL